MLKDTLQAVFIFHECNVVVRWRGQYVVRVAEEGSVIVSTKGNKVERSVQVGSW